MTAKEYLRQLSRREARIKALIERQQRYRELAARRTAVYRDAPGGGKRRASPVEEYTVKIVDLEREIGCRIGEYAGLTREIEAAIDRIDDDRYRDILRFRYVNGWGWERIAREMHYELRWLHYLHSRALQEFRVPDERSHENAHPDVL